MKKRIKLINYYNREGGFNLIEIILAVALIAIALPALSSLYALAIREESHVSRHSQAVALASSLMDEISQRRFRESVSSPGNGIDSGEEIGYDRRNFDDADDYDIFDQSWGAQSPPRDESGSQLSNYSVFSQKVTVINVANPTSGPTARSNYSDQGDGNTNFKLVTVTISWDESRRSVKLYKVFALE